MPLLTAGPSRFLGGGNVIWLLRDEFTSDLAAGAVNGTAAEPGPGTRAARDVESKTSISGGNLVLAAQASPVFNDQDIVYADVAITRAAGRLTIQAINLGASTADDMFFACFVTANPPNWGTQMQGGFYTTVGTFKAHDIYAASRIVAAAAVSTSYIFATVLRASGYFGFIKGGLFTNWTLLWRSDTGNTATLYPAMSNFSGDVTSQFVRIPDTLWLPTPLVSDSFATTFATSDGLGHAEGIATGIGAGGGGVTWTGATWSVSGGKAINTPATLGSELIVNGGFVDGSAWTVGANWTIGSGVATHAVGAGSSISQTPSVSNKWCVAQVTVVRSAGSLSFRFGAAVYSTIIASTGTHKRISWCNNAFAGITPTTDFDGTIDDVSWKELTLSELITSVSASTANVVAGVALTVTTGLPAGLCLNLDSASSPANFVLAYYDGASVNLVKCVAGVYTSLIATGATYSAGARLVVTKDNTAYRVYYNNALVGTEQTIADAGIISNTLHGLFSTDAGNTLDDFVVYARGNEGQYAALDRYSGS